LPEVSQKNICEGRTTDKHPQMNIRNRTSADDEYFIENPYFIVLSLIIGPSGDRD